MEGFSGNENTLIQDEGCKNFLNENQCENERMKKLKKTQVYKLKKVEFQKMMKNKGKKWNHYIPKGEREGLTIKMPYVGHLLM